MDSSSIASNPSIEAVPISQSAADPILANETSSEPAMTAPATVITSTSEGTTVTGPASDSAIDTVATKLQTANAKVAQFASTSIELAREGAHDLEKRTNDLLDYMADVTIASQELATDIAKTSKNVAIEKAAASKQFLLEKAKSTKDFTVEKASHTKEVIVDSAAASKAFVLEKAESSKNFTVEKASESKEFLLEKAKSTKDFTVEKASLTKEVIAEKAEASKNFAVMEYGKGKSLFWYSWDASRNAFWNGTQWISKKSIDSYKFALQKTQSGGHWLYQSVVPIVKKSLHMTHDVAEKGKDGLSFVSAKAEELEKKLVDMPYDATETMGSLAGTPVSTLGTSQLENMSTFYSTLAQPADKIAPMKGTSEERSSLIHQE